MSDQLNYPGDCTAFDPDQILGPDIFGACYRPVAADYDPQTDVTTLTLVPIPPADLEELRQQKLGQTMRQLAAAVNFASLFQGFGADE